MSGRHSRCLCGPGDGLGANTPDSLSSIQWLGALSLQQRNSRSSVTELERHITPFADNEGTSQAEQIAVHARTASCASWDHEAS